MVLAIQNPYDLTLIGELPLQSKQEVIAAIGKAARAPLLPIEERLRVLKQVGTLIEERFETFVETAVREGGKPWVDTEVEVRRAIQGIECAYQELCRQAGEMVPMRGQHRLAFTVPEPAGVVLAYSAFNHPLNMVIHQVIPAIATGCPVVVKPALTTPYSCQLLVETIHEAGLPPHLCQMIICEDAVAEKMVSDQRLAFFSFVGSAAVGWRLRSKLGPGVRCVLEHGGAAPVVVLDHADEAPMLPLLAKGAFYHAGQVCVSVQRVYVPRPMAMGIAEELAELAAKLKVGDPLIKETDVGPLIRSSGIDRMEKLVGASGGKVLCGGKRLSETTYTPTVILDPSDDALVSREEIFGPVVCVYSTGNKEEAIARANALPFSFQAALFGTHIDEVIEVARRLQADAVMVNDHTAFRVDWMPFGASKESGLGRGGIPYAMADMTRDKLVVIRSHAI
jgi:acyl-CoA reductase-like NAD-dependent aldehyde dehydrogenase